MEALVTAWAVGEGIIIYRQVRINHAPPVPGALLAASGLYVMLALLAGAGPGASALAVTLAWGFNAAALLNLLPQVTGGQPPASSGTGPAVQAV